MFDNLVGLSSTTTLHNGVKMPVLGIGVWRVGDGSEVEATIRHAFEAGYRSIDTAAAYHNENGVGNAIMESNIPREEIFVTTKVGNTEQGYDSTMLAFEESMKKLKLDYLDLYLIHWPVKGKYKDTWRAMEKLYKDGRIRAIGVCNFHIHHLEDLIECAEIVPMVNQVECHPLLTQVKLREYCKKNKIQFEAWSPLMQGNLDLPVLTQLGKKYRKSPAQIVLRWDLQNEIVTIPKSANKNRIIENANVFDFELSSEDMEAINNLNQDKRFGANPDTFDS